MGRIARERIGYPTQKPIALYERVIQASCTRGDIVLDPFCGCATTLLAAERTGRQWVGMDIWDEAHETVLLRLFQDGLDIKGAGTKSTFQELEKRGIGAELLQRTLPTPGGEVYYTTRPPNRTDNGETATPPLRVKTKRYQPEPAGPRMTRAEIIETLIKENGLVCQGCNRTFDDARYLELDHITPRSEGGINHISNRTLLCGPCNRTKSNRLTLTGLRRQNARDGFMQERQA